MRRRHNTFLFLLSFSVIAFFRITEKAYMSDSQSAAMGNIIPMPVSVQATGQTFTLSPDAGIYVQAGNDELLRIGQYLADKLNPATGYAKKVAPVAKAPAQANIYLTT